MKIIEKIPPKVRNLFDNYIFLIILLAYPLISVNQGADLSDTTYSLGNYMFFDQITGGWKYATFLANLLGRFLMTITGGRMLYMNLATGLIVSLTAGLIYFFFRKKTSPLLLFWGEIIAISLCWCPTVILYNYLSYLVLTGALLLIWFSLEKQKPWMLLWAGLLLGLNVLVRTSNLTQVAFILVIWFDVWMKKDRRIWKETGICILGFAAGLLLGVAAMMLFGGAGGYLEMVNWLLSLLTSEESAGGYSMSAMLLTIVKNYGKELKWLAIMLAAIAAGIGGFSVWKDKFLLVKKIGYTICVCILFVYFYRNGVFTGVYYNDGCIFHVSVLFILISFLVFLAVLFDKKETVISKKLAVLNLVLLLILPLGSNNHLYCIINYMFVIAPSCLYLGSRLWKKYGTKVRMFPAKAVAGVFLLVLTVQVILFHGNYVFCDGVDGTVRDGVVTSDNMLKGMHTGAAHAGCIDELDGFIKAGSISAGTTILSYGNLPGMSYLLEMPSALTSSWPDLDSFSETQFEQELQLMKVSEEYPLVVLSSKVNAYMTVDREMEEQGETISDEELRMEELQKNLSSMLSPAELESYEQDEKINDLEDFLTLNGYVMTFSNEEFVVLQRRND